MKTRATLIVCLAGILAFPMPARTQTNPNIISFAEGMLTWTNADTNLYYSIEWRPSLADTSEWTASYRACQDLRSTNPTVTALVPVFYRVLRSSNAEQTRVLSPASSNLAAGYYEETTLSAVDTDLTADSIKQGVTIFGITGTVPAGVTYKASPPRTRQLTSYLADDDGDLQRGAAWPSPRFTDHGDGTVSDLLTGLMWTKNAGIWGGISWTAAVQNCASHSLGEYSDWRLPNVRELHSLIDYNNWFYAMPPGHPFTNLQYHFNFYWTSTTHADASPYVWRISIVNGVIASDGKWLTNAYAWPVRGGAE